MHTQPPDYDDTLQSRALDEISFGSMLCTKGERVTKARVRVLAALSKFDRPVPIKELAGSVKDHNLATIYRTLETLVSIRLVRKISIDPSESLYETTIGRPHHHHITCTSCGHIEPLDTCASEPSKATLRSKGFASVTDHSLEFFGLCKKCSA